MKKEKIKILVLIVMILYTTACGKESGAIETEFSKNLKVSDLSINDFAFETNRIKKYGDDYYVTTLTNNSDYSIIAFQLEYELKEGVDDAELNVYKGFMKEHADWIDSDDVTEVILRATGEKLTRTGDSIEKAPLYSGYGSWSWYDVPNKSQYELMEPKELQIAIIGKDDVLYLAYYNFEDAEWILDEMTVQLNTWPSTALAEEISKPNCDYMLLTSDIDSEEYINFTAYEITENKFNDYVQTMKDNGFVINIAEISGFYSAENDNGYNLSISYEEDKEIMQVDIYNY